MLRNLTEGWYLCSHKHRRRNFNAYPNIYSRESIFLFNSLTTVRFSKTEIFIFKKLKFQTSTSPELKSFRTKKLISFFLFVFCFVLDRSMPRYTTTGGLLPLQTPFGTPVSRRQRINAERLKCCNILLITCFY